MVKIINSYDQLSNWLPFRVLFTSTIPVYKPNLFCISYFYIMYENLLYIWLNIKKKLLVKKIERLVPKNETCRMLMFAGFVFAL